MFVCDGLGLDLWAILQGLYQATDVLLRGKTGFESIGTQPQQPRPATPRSPFHAPTITILTPSPSRPRLNEISPLTTLENTPGDQEHVYNNYDNFTHQEHYYWSPLVPVTAPAPTETPTQFQVQVRFQRDEFSLSDYLHYFGLEETDSDTTLTNNNIYAISKTAFGLVGLPGGGSGSTPGNNPRGETPMEFVNRKLKLLRMAGITNEQEQMESIHRGLQNAPELQNAVVFAHESGSLERYKSALLNATDSGRSLHEKTSRSSKSKTASRTTGSSGTTRSPYTDADVQLSNDLPLTVHDYKRHRGRYSTRVSINTVRYCSHS
ncbi:hypothetical protein TWF481_002927 [Arthrobotrys musiformis]|uniref:Uncharacterized protein n=1 Tax=Arthrobotrys musiformis TaxID=47236 RepID=A0AAV9VRP4_9PEZI